MMITPGSIGASLQIIIINSVDSTLVFSTHLLMSEQRPVYVPVT